MGFDSALVYGFMAIALVCFSGANIASGAMAAWLLDIYGWQIGFWMGAALPLMGLPLLLLVPESLPFRVARDPGRTAVTVFIFLYVASTTCLCCNSNMKEAP